MKERLLLKLADYLDTIRWREFDLSLWWGDRDFANECGTVGCAMGHACQIPIFQRAGLRMWHGEPYFEDPKKPWRRNFGLVAAEMLFEISSGDAYNLFMARSYRYGARTRPHTVAKRIRRLVAEKGKV